MIINTSIDIEDEVRTALSKYIPTYCRPLPVKYKLPHIQVTWTGGTDSDTIDSFVVSIDSRANTDAEANETLRDAIGILKHIAKEQSCAIRTVSVNSMGSWGDDPVRPDLSMCSATLKIVAHETTKEI